MRELTTEEESAYVEALIDILNFVFGHNVDSDSYWKNFLSPAIKNKYPSCLTDEEVSDFQLIRDSVEEVLLFKRLSSLLGIKWTAEVLNRVETDESFLKKSEEPFSETDVEELCPILKHLHQIFFQEGTALSRLAVSKSSGELTLILL